MRISEAKIAQAMPCETVRSIRSALGLTQAQLAAATGLSSPNVVSDYERGRRRVPDYFARHILLLERLMRWEKVGKACERHAENGYATRAAILELLQESPLLVRT